MPLNNSLAYLPPQIHTSSFSSDGNPHSHTESSEFGSWSGDMDDTLAREALDSLFDDYIRADAYSPSSSSAGGAPCFIESVLEPCSPTWLFDFGTPEGPPTSGRPGSLRQIVDTDTVADGLFPWPPAACGVVQEIARDTREQHIAEDIPFISDILAPPTAACLGRDPSSLLEAVHPHPSTDVEVPDPVVAPRKIVAGPRAQSCSSRGYSHHSSYPSSVSSSRPASPAPSTRSPSRSIRCSRRKSRARSSPKSQISRNRHIPLGEFAAVVASGLEWRKKCPFCAQRQKCPNDFERHVGTHCPEGAYLLEKAARSGRAGRIPCVGVPHYIAAQYGVANLTTVHTAVVNGVQMVGGCGKTFSRRDAWLRHLRNPNVACLGDMTTRGKKSVYRKNRP